MKNQEIKRENRNKEQLDRYMLQLRQIHIKNVDKSFANFNLVDKIISNFVTYKARQWWDLGPIKIMKSIWTIETDKAGWLATGGMARGKKNI